MAGISIVQAFNRMDLVRGFMIHPISLIGFEEHIFLYGFFDSQSCPVN